MEFSRFAKRFEAESGIFQLMEDLGEAMINRDRILMLGGGNPAHIPAVLEYFQKRMQWFVENPDDFSRTIGDYDSPRGEKKFILALTEFFRRHYHWDLGPENIVLSAGSQSGFFMLFNTFAGEYSGGRFKRILFPMVPEYIGYGDVGLSDNMFTSNRPDIETFTDHTFKYHVSFDRLNITEDIGAICVSRPTNPTGNVITDDEIHRLHALAVEHQIPLIVDNAYGMPFPDIIFTEASLQWTEQTILCMTLSKLGLPAVRTGIIIARKEITELITRMNGIINLALGSFGPALAVDLIVSDRIMELSRNEINPFYKSKSEKAMAMFHQELDGLDYFIHKSEGAIFLWLWFPGLPISCKKLYERLKGKGVLILSGHYFFPGLNHDWQHTHECIRVSYAMDEGVVNEGIKIIAEEVKRAFKES